MGHALYVPIHDSSREGKLFYAVCSSKKRVQGVDLKRFMLLIS